MLAINTRFATMLDRQIKDIKFAIRSMTKNPTFFAAAAATLVLAIGVSGAIYSVADAVLIRPLAFRDPARLVRLWTTVGASEERFGLSHNEVLALKASKVFDEVAETFPYELSVETPTGTLRTRAAHVDAEIFSILGIRAVIGRTFESEETEVDGARIAVLSYRTWVDSFAQDSGVVGRTYTINGQPYQVIGVLEEALQKFPIAGDHDRMELVEIWTPLARIRKNMLRFSGSASKSRAYGVVARLRDGVTMSLAESRIRNLSEQLRRDSPVTNSDVTIRATSLHRAIVGNVRPVVLLLSCAVGMVVWIACANLANLFLARGVTRRKEMAIRRTMGASTSDLMVQIVTESLVLALISAVGAIALAGSLVALIRQSVPPGLPMFEQAEISWRIIMFCFALALLTGIAFGFVPALKLSRVELNDVLNLEAGRGSSDRTSRFVAALIAVQVMLSVALTCVAFLMSNSLLRLSRLEMGFRPDNLLTMKVALPISRFPNSDRAAQLGFFNTVLNRIEGESIVYSAAASSSLPLESGSTVGVQITGQPELPEERLPRVFPTSVTARYFSTLGIKIVRGREISERDSSDRPWVAVINEAMAQRYWGGNALGKQIQMTSDGQVRTIIGVVNNVTQETIGETPSSHVYVPFVQTTQWAGYATISVRTKIDADAASASLVKLTQSIDPMLGLSRVNTMNTLVDESLAPSRFRTLLFNGLAFLALILAAVGIYGLISYRVEQRTREIGIRMALGASRAHILALTLGEALLLTFVGAAAGIALTIALSEVLRKFVFGIEPTEPALLSAAVVAVIVATATAALIPSLRALRVDPAISLRTP